MSNTARRALLAEIDRVNRAVMAAHLRAEGYVVKTVTGLQEALRLAQDTAFQLAVCDLEIPGMDGLEFRRRLARGAGRDVPILFLTERVDRPRESFVLRDAPLLLKPVPRAQLRAALEYIRAREDRRMRRDGATLSGSLLDYSVADLTRFMDRYGLSGRGTFEHAGVVATIDFSAGQPADARLGNARGTDAFFRLLAFDEGTFSVDLSDSRTERTIRRPLVELLVEGLTRADQWMSVRSRLPGEERAFWVLLDEVAASCPDERSREALYGNVQSREPLLGEVLHSGAFERLEAIARLAEDIEAGRVRLFSVTEDELPEEEGEPALTAAVEEPERERPEPAPRSVQVEQAPPRQAPASVVDPFADTLPPGRTEPVVATDAATEPIFFPAPEEEGAPAVVREVGPNDETPRPASMTPDEGATATDIGVPTVVEDLPFGARAHDEAESPEPRIRMVEPPVLDEEPPTREQLEPASTEGGGEEPPAAALPEEEAGSGPEEEAPETFKYVATEEEEKSAHEPERGRVTRGVLDLSDFEREEQQDRAQPRLEAAVQLDEGDVSSGDGADVGEASEPVAEENGSDEGTGDETEQVAEPDAFDDTLFDEEPLFDDVPVTDVSLPPLDESGGEISLPLLEPLFDDEPIFDEDLPFADEPTPAFGDHGAVLRAQEEAHDAEELPESYGAGPVLTAEDAHEHPSMSEVEPAELGEPEVAEDDEAEPEHAEMAEPTLAEDGEAEPERAEMAEPDAEGATVLEAFEPPVAEGVGDADTEVTLAPPGVEPKDRTRTIELVWEPPLAELADEVGPDDESQPIMDLGVGKSRDTAPYEMLGLEIGAERSNELPSEDAAPLPGPAPRGVPVESDAVSSDDDPLERLQADFFAQAPVDGASSQEIPVPDPIWQLEPDDAPARGRAAPARPSHRKTMGAVGILVGAVLVVAVVAWIISGTQMGTVKSGGPPSTKGGSGAAPHQPSEQAQGAEPAPTAPETGAGHVEAMAFYRAGRLPEAEAAYAKLAATDPDDEVAHVNLASVLIDRGKPEEARKLLEDFLKDHPDSASAQLSLAVLLHQEGALDLAKGAYEHFLETAPPNHPQVANVKSILETL